MDKAFEIHAHWEENGEYFIDTDYRQLSTIKKTQYDKAVKDGFVIIKIDDGDVI